MVSGLSDRPASSLYLIVLTFDEIRKGVENVTDHSCRLQRLDRLLVATAFA
jgi:hypothetical protein